MSKTHFEESQKFTQWWIWMLLVSGLLLLVGIAGAGVYAQLIEGRPFGNKPMSDNGVVIFLILSILFSVALIVFMKSFHLQTKVDRYGITYRFFPLIQKWHTIYREDILSWNIVNKCVFNYGIHYGLNSKTLNIYGNTQLTLKLASGKTLNLGTQHPEELMRAYEAWWLRYYRR